MTYQLTWFLAFLTFQSHSGPLLHLIMLIMHRFWPFLAFKNAFLWLLNDPSRPGTVAKSLKTFSTIIICNIKSIQQPYAQYTSFWHLGSCKNTFSWLLNDPSWPGSVAERWKTFSTITICNIKSIQQTKLLKLAKNLYFGSLDHSKMYFCDFWMIQDQRYQGQIVQTI